MSKSRFKLGYEPETDEFVLLGSNTDVFGWVLLAHLSDDDAANIQKQIQKAREFRSHTKASQ